MMVGGLSVGGAHGCLSAQGGLPYVGQQGPRSRLFVLDGVRRVLHAMFDLRGSNHLELGQMTLNFIQEWRMSVCKRDHIGWT